MTAFQKSFPLAGSHFKFAQHGRNGAWVSELLPHTARIVDELCIVKSMQTEAINHDPAVTFFQTGSQQAGRPWIGVVADLRPRAARTTTCRPSSCCSRGHGSGDQPLYRPAVGHRLSAVAAPGRAVPRRQGPGALPVESRGRRPQRPAPHARRLARAERRCSYATVGDPEIAARIAQYEMAYRMQTCVPELMDLSNEPDHVLDLYGPDARKPGTFAANCLLARRLAERGVRFIQLYHRGWDQHGNLPERHPRRSAKTIDQPSAALVRT